MTALAFARETTGDVLADYESFVTALNLDKSVRSTRRIAARGFVRAHPDHADWMTRSTPARLIDLHRHKAWPLLTWLLIEERVRVDLELLLAKPPGVDIGVWWMLAHPDDVADARRAAATLGWGANWTHQVIQHTMPVVCLWLGKTLAELTDADFDAAPIHAGRACIKASTRIRFTGRCLALRQLCFQLGVVAEGPRDSKKPALSAAEHAASISQPAIQREVVRYAEVISTTLRPNSARARVKAIRVLAGWLAESHPDVSRLDQLERTVHIEPFLVWARTRLRRGTNAQGRTIGLVGFHHDLVDLRVFFDDIAEWGWPTAPQKRLFFLTDFPRLPDPLPRALTPDQDRALADAVAHLDDHFARVGLSVLRATGTRVGELLDLELDCVVDFDSRGIWLRVPMGKLNTERMVPLDPEPLELLKTWITQRVPQRSLPHPRDGHLTDFVFCDRGRRLGKHRLSQGLQAAVRSAGLTDRSGQPSHITPHQLRHTFGTSLVNAGVSLPALMALMGHVTPEMTLRYAKLGSPAIRTAYENAMTKINGRRPMFIIPAAGGRAIPAKVDWLHSEMLKTRVAHGFCSRDLVAGACAYANICEQCDNFIPDPAQAAVLANQLADVRDLQHDAEHREWTGEAARHEHVALALEGHLRAIEREQADRHPR